MEEQGLMADVGDFAGDVGTGLLGAGGMIGEFLLAAKAPAMYKQMMYDRGAPQREAEAQAQRQRQEQWAQGIPSMRPVNMHPDAFSMEEAQVMQSLDPKSESYKPAATATEMTRYLANSPYQSYRKVGAGLISDKFKQKPQYTNIVRGAQGNAFGINQQGVQQRLSGEAVPQRQQSPLVQNVIKNGQGPQKPTAPSGMETIWDNSINNWRFRPVAGGKFDETGAENVMKETEGFNKDAFKYNDVLSKIDNYASVQSEIGNTMNPYSPEGRLLNQAQTQVLMGLKDAFELGVLTGPDERLINEVMPPATGIINTVMLKSSDVQEMIQRARKGIMRSRSKLRTKYPNAKQPAPANKSWDDTDMNELKALRERFRGN